MPFIISFGFMYGLMFGLVVVFKGDMGKFFTLQLQGMTLLIAAVLAAPLSVFVAYVMDESSQA